MPLNLIQLPANIIAQKCAGDEYRCEEKWKQDEHHGECCKDLGHFGSIGLVAFFKCPALPQERRRHNAVGDLQRGGEFELPLFSVREGPFSQDMQVQPEQPTVPLAIAAN